MDGEAGEDEEEVFCVVRLRFSGVLKHQMLNIDSILPHIHGYNVSRGK